MAEVENEKRAEPTTVEKTKGRVRTMIGSADLLLDEDRKDLAKKAALIQEDVCEAAFLPTPAQARLKVKLQKRLQRGELTKSDLTPDRLAFLFKETKLKGWMKNPNFVNWLLAENDLEDRISVLAELAFGRAQDLLSNVEVKASDQIALIKMIFEAKKAIPRKESYSKKDVNVTVHSTSGQAHPAGVTVEAGVVEVPRITSDSIDQMSEDELLKLAEQVGL
jgi:hypothetical protein